MLRMEKNTDEQTTIISLIGRVQSDHLAELRTQMESNGPRIILNLEEVTLVDVGVVRFLSTFERAGVTLLHCPPYVRDWIIQERGTGKQGDSDQTHE